MFAVAFSVMVAQRIAAVAVTVVNLAKAFQAAATAGTLLPVSYTHLTLPTNREV